MGPTPLIACSSFTKSFSSTSLPLKAITVAPRKKNGIETVSMAKSMPKSHHHQFRSSLCKGCGREVHGVDFGRFFAGALSDGFESDSSVFESSRRKLGECDGVCNLMESMVIKIWLCLFWSGIGIDGDWLKILNPTGVTDVHENPRNLPSDLYV